MMMVLQLVVGKMTRGRKLRWARSWEHQGVNRR
jgi:hypothetical protein